MIEEFKTNLAATLTANTGVGEHLEGVTVYVGDVIPAAKDHPAITVDWEDNLDANRQKSANGRVRLELDFRVCLYVSSYKGVKAAHAAMNNLILRAGETSYLGLHPLLSGLANTSTFTDSLGNVWAITLLPDSERGVVKSENAQFASVACAFKVQIWTVVTAAQY